MFKSLIFLPVNFFYIKISSYFVNISLYVLWNSWKEKTDKKSTLKALKALRQLQIGGFSPEFGISHIWSPSILNRHVKAHQNETKALFYRWDLEFPVMNAPKPPLRFVYARRQKKWMENSRRLWLKQLAMIGSLSYFVLRITSTGLSFT